MVVSRGQGRCEVRSEQWLEIEAQEREVHGALAGVSWQTDWPEMVLSRARLMSGSKSTGLDVRGISEGKAGSSYCT